MIVSKRLPRIFVQIVSYRDNECQWTIKDLFDKAAHPERIHVGLCLQNDPDDDADCFVNDPPYPDQVRIASFHARDAKGAGWAREEAQKLWQGEEYVLQIQAHMRFEQGWDDLLIDMLACCPSEKPIIGGYLPPYEPPDKRRVYAHSALLRTRVREFGRSQQDPQILHLSGIGVLPQEKERYGLYPSPVWIGNFMFAEARVFQEVPHDPHIYFWGEELAYSVRLWTRGWDIFQPDAVVMYHQWDRKPQTSTKQDYRQMGNDPNQRSLKRILHILGLKQTDDANALAEIERYGLGFERSLADWEAFVGINLKQRTATKDAEAGKWNMKAREKALAKSQKNKTPRIFVQIASYRDPDCQRTVEDLFKKAAHPERIFVGICWQFVKGEDDHCFEIPYPFPKQVRVQEVDAKKSQGVCWARAQTQKLWKGEEFTLQIDSHMRFEPGWDNMLLSMWDECDNKKAVLTCYPPGFTPPDKLERAWIFGMGAKQFDQHDIFTMHGKPAFAVGQGEPAKPIPGAFASGCMLFAPSSIIEDVPYDPYLYFFGEEILMAVRLWTHGYDLFHPNKLALFHDWDRDKRPTHFSDHRDWGKLNDRALARVRHLLGTQVSKDKDVLKDIKRYGLGKERTLEEYERYSGVNFAKKTISSDALKGHFMPYSQKAAVKSMGKQPRIFVNIASYRDAECQWTVKDLFEKATYPDRVFVGICWQFDEKEDQHCFEVSTRPDQVRIFPVDWIDAEGVCWARYQTQQLWDGEEYTLMIDSHMRFVPGWDELMIEELALCDSKKPVLSCSPVPYTPPNQLGTKTNPTFRRVKPFTPDGNIRCQGEMLDRAPEKPLHGAFLVANFVFSRSDIISEVPYDPYLYFDQEEITYAARLYTHGWDIYSPRRQFLYHFYNDGKAPANVARPLHWSDLRKKDEKRINWLRNRGLQRFNHMTGHKVSNDPEVIRELDVYGFGRVRSLQQFEEFSGVDFKRKIASDKALRGGFIPDLKKYRDRPIHIPEIDNVKKAAAGAPVTLVTPQTPVSKPLQMPAQKSIQKSLTTGLKPLELGDFVPLFEITDTNQKTRALEVYGGKYVLFFYLPTGNVDYLARFFRALHQQLQDKPDLWQIFTLSDSVDNLIALKPKIGTQQTLWADPDRRVAQALGLLRPGDNQVIPTGYVLNPNLQIMHRHMGLDPEQLAAATVADCRKELEQYKLKNQSPQTISQLAPALIVPNVFTPEMCAKCIQAFRTGNTFEGTVGAAETKAYRPDTKVRTDFIPSGALLDEIDEKLSRSFFPEIKKIFGVEILHRERYKIGLYTGEKGGFFKQHRDNFDKPLGYRRIASTVHLNDDYEGGGLHFPEYDRNIYRPAAGSAIAFSCSTLHEARPVTKGERFILVAFLHGEEDEAFRRYYMASRGDPIKVEDYTPTLRRYPQLIQSRDFVKDWREENVSFTKEAAGTTAAAAPTRPNIMINTLGNHKAKKVYESKGAIIFDDFLPEDVYKKVNDFALTTDYEYINTKGKVTRAWHVHDGFPLRSTLNVFYHAEGTEKPKADYIYPTKTNLDPFVDHIRAMQPNVNHITGKEGEWGHFSVTSWLYPHGTGLSMHDDGSGVYTGAYVYFLNPVWRPHWGGLLLLVEEEGNRLIHGHRATVDQSDFYKRKWLHANAADDLIMQHGFAQCILPKRNRVVFIANDAYHMVTRVNEQAGDNIRMSLAGFFNRKK